MSPFLNSDATLHLLFLFTSRCPPSFSCPPVLRRVYIYTCADCFYLRIGLFKAAAQVFHGMYFDMSQQIQACQFQGLLAYWDTLN